MTRLGEAVAPPRLGHPFRWLLASSWAGNLGDGISLAAGPLLVASQTRVPLRVALAAVLQRLPWLVFGLLAGVLADRVDRRRIIVAVHLSRAVIAAAISALIISGHIDITVVLVALFVLGASEVLADTTAPTLLPMIVARGDLGGVIAERFGVTGPFWFAFAGSGAFLVLIWAQLPHVAVAEDTENAETVRGGVR